MDCEKFDKVALEMLYDELDELTSAAARRHMDHCSRCGLVGARMRATREVGALPSITPPAGLSEKILRLERDASQALPLRERVGRGISVLAGYAMRPQLAMAALLLLMIGSSFLFLRAKPTDADSVRVTERGIRETDESVAIVPLPEEPDELPPKSPAPRTAAEAKKVVAATTTESPARSASLGDEQPGNLLDAGAEAESASAAYDGAMSSYRRGDYRTAQVEFEAIAAEAGEHAPSAQLFAAHSVRGNTGCADAAPKFDAVQRKFPGTNVGQEAAWQAATCYRSLGHLELARQHYQRLLEAPAYADRAQHALLRLDRQPGEVVATRKSTVTKAPASALPKATKAGSKAGSSADSNAGAKPESGPSLSPKQ